jgi:hypothetical protein
MAQESKSSDLSSTDLKTWTQAPLDDASNASTTVSSPEPRHAGSMPEPPAAAHARSKAISSALLLNPLFAKKSMTSVFNRFGPLGSLLEYAASHDATGADVLRAECQAFESCVRKVPNFSNISSAQMLHTIKNAVRKTATAGELLLREGDSSGSMLYIHAGHVAVSSASKGFIAHIYQDNIVGHHSYIYNRPRTATVHAATESNAGLIFYEFSVVDAQHGALDGVVRKRSSVISPSASCPAPLSTHSSSFEQPLPTAADVADSATLVPAPSHVKRYSMSLLSSIDEGGPHHIIASSRVICSALHIFLTQLFRASSLSPRSVARCPWRRSAQRRRVERRPCSFERRQRCKSKPKFPSGRERASCLG